MKALAKFKLFTQSKNFDDYIFWNKIPKEYKYVAIDSKDSITTTGVIAFKAGIPVAYTDKPTLIDGRWVQSVKPRYAPIVVPKEAIIGELPSSAESLRERSV